VPTPYYTMSDYTMKGEEVIEKFPELKIGDRVIDNTNKLHGFIIDIFKHNCIEYCSIEYDDKSREPRHLENVQKLEEEKFKIGEIVLVNGGKTVGKITLIHDHDHYYRYRIETLYGNGLSGNFKESEIKKTEELKNGDKVVFIKKDHPYLKHGAKGEFTSFTGGGSSFICHGASFTVSEGKIQKEDLVKIS